MRALAVDWLWSVGHGTWGLLRQVAGMQEYRWEWTCEMPELPEVETVRRGLEPVMAGQRFVGVVQRRPDLRFPFPERFAERLTGATLLHLARRAKYLVARLSTAEVLIMHLGMSGRFSITLPTNKGRSSPAADTMSNSSGSVLGDSAYNTGNDPTHEHAVFEMSGGARITYNDPRRFGYMLLIPQAEMEVHALFNSLGVEPLGNALTPGYLAERAAGKATDLKAFLMDQRIVAGLGNIYVCEALHRAGLSPKRGAASLADRKVRPTERAERLVPAIRAVLDEAIAAGGSTLRDYKQADGSLGYFQHRFRVYGREGEPCAKPACDGVVRRIVQTGRSTFYCGTCQH